MKKLLVGLLVGILLLAGSLVGAEDPKVIRWAIAPATEEATELKLWAPTIEYLSEKIGIPVKGIICADHIAVIQALKFGHAEMSRFGPFAYILATTQMELEPLVREIKVSTRMDSYYALVITQRHSTIEKLEDLKGKTFAFSDPGSCSGYLWPMTQMLKAGIDPKTDLARTFFTHSHGATIISIVKGKVDAGCVPENRLIDAIEAGVLREQDVVVILRSKPLYNPPTTVRKNLSEDLKRRIREAFLSIPEDIAIKSKTLGYVPAKDEDYDQIREIAEVLELDLTKYEKE